MTWTNRYIGIPDAPKGRTAEGCDCWGLAMLVYRQERGVELPDYASEYDASRRPEVLESIYKREIAAGSWKQVQQPEPFDLALFRTGRHDSHVGIVCAPGVMLHVAKGDYAKLQRYGESPWSSRFIGFYRWVG